MKILVVDDNSNVLKALARTLKHLGHAVHGAPSYREGLQRLRELSPEALVTDLELGDGLGTDLIRTARSERLSAHYVLVTGNTAFVVPEDLPETHLLPKPWNSDALAAALEPPVVECVARAPGGRHGFRKRMD